MKSYAFLLLLVAVVVTDARKQCISLRGEVKCPQNKDRAKHIFVKLMDSDVGPDDTIDTGYTSSTGMFYLHGCVGDPPFTTIDPRLEVYHRCKGVAKKLTLTIPEKYVGRDDVLTTPLNLGGVFQCREHPEGATIVTRECEENTSIQTGVCPENVRDRFYRSLLEVGSW